MLFNSYIFIFLFLPITLAGFFLLGRRAGGQRGAIAWLVAASLFFYGWWNPTYVLLIILSIVINYGVGLRVHGQGRHADKVGRRLWLTLGICFNLGLLGYFKYANFFVDEVLARLGGEWYLAPIILPLAISFFTFQQVAYLVDSYRGEAEEHSFLHYCLFVTFFPQLIAGPIVHHSEMLPQFARPETYRFQARNLAIGVTIFMIGLSKKVIIADSVALYATPAFTQVLHGGSLTFFEGWLAALCYTLQIYFDFSGYSDMAIGIACMFGICLPVNFHSPYKAWNIIEFWRRWHITLSRFLRDYLYIPLGGNRKGKGRRYANLMTTMLLGGLWHGAGWTFVIWGGLHGFYLIVNHMWQRLGRRLGDDAGHSWLGRGLGIGLTFVCVMIAWVFFRAESPESAFAMLTAMSGANGFVLPEGLGKIGAVHDMLAPWGVQFGGLNIILSPEVKQVVTALPVIVLIAFFLPNTQQLMGQFNPGLMEHVPADTRKRKAWVQWQPTMVWALYTGVLALACLLFMTRVSEFLYFQF